MTLRHSLFGRLRKLEVRVDRATSLWPCPICYRGKKRRRVDGLIDELARRLGRRSDLQEQRAAEVGFEQNTAGSKALNSRQARREPNLGYGGKDCYFCGGTGLVNSEQAADYTRKLSNQYAYDRSTGEVKDLHPMTLEEFLAHLQNKREKLAATRISASAWDHATVEASEDPEDWNELEDSEKP